MVVLPRVVVAAAASGQGKTTVAVGLMAALSRAGLTVSPGKVGPDYIDPGYHALATGRPGRNLDPWLVGEDLIAPLMLHGAQQPTTADISIIEGVMGLFDGQLGTDGFASTAHVAQLTASPIVLVLDISAASRTIAATVAGITAFAPQLTIAGVILNKVGSPRHASEVRKAVESVGVPVIGVLPRDAGVSAPSRHLGLIPVAERPEAAARLDRLAEQITEFCDLTALRQIAETAPPLDISPWSPEIRKPVGETSPVVAVAGGRAFTFRYAETDELLRAQGLEPVVFDPVLDRELPAGTCGLYLGGGFPEMHATSLASNRSLLNELAEAISAGIPTVAECAGLLYLCQTVSGYGFVGAVPAEAKMQPHLILGYRQARLGSESILGVPNEWISGHEFHRTQTTPVAGDHPAWRLAQGTHGFVLDPAKTGRGTLHGSYLHVHWAGYPKLAMNFSAAVHDFATSELSLKKPVSAISYQTEGSVLTDEFAGQQITDPLLHHGDAELGEGLVDFAVNVRLKRPPKWLETVINTATTRLGAYPQSTQVLEALARYFQVGPDMVLPTAGAAEAFTLIAQAIRGKAVVIHPQFTEPEAALRRFGRDVVRHILTPYQFALDPKLVPSADLLMAGNPTNPTGVLYPAQLLRQLNSGVLVVDEAFMDAVPGQSETLISEDMTGQLVLRSFTKTWGLAGLRAGCVIGDPELIARLAAYQTPWSVSTPALAVMDAICTPAAHREVTAAALNYQLYRDHLITGLRRLGINTIESKAPFVLAQVGDGVHSVLREKGFAVRRADTFPGLDSSFVRIALRDPYLTDALLRELSLIIKEKHEW